MMTVDACHNMRTYSSVILTLGDGKNPKGDDWLICSNFVRSLGIALPKMLAGEQYRNPSGDDGLTSSSLVRPLETHCHGQE